MHMVTRKAESWRARNPAARLRGTAEMLASRPGLNSVCIGWAGGAGLCLASIVVRQAVTGPIHAGNADGRNAALEEQYDEVSGCIGCPDGTLCMPR